MDTTKETGKALRIAKIFQVICLVAVLLFVDTLYWNPDVNEISGNMALGANVLKIITIVLVIIGILCLLSGYFLSRVIIKAQQVNPTGKKVKIFPFFSNIRISCNCNLRSGFRYAWRRVADHFTFLCRFRDCFDSNISY